MKSPQNKGQLRLTLTTGSGLMIASWTIDEADLLRLLLAGDKVPADVVRRVIEQYLPVDEPGA